MLSEVFTVINNAEMCDDDSIKTESLMTAIALLGKHLNSFPEDPEAWYGIGLAYYELPKRSVELDSLTTRSLRQCVELQSDHKFALMLLGCHLFDRGDFQQAKEALIQVLKTPFIGALSWRNAKALELLLCCEFALNGQVTEDIRRLFLSMRERYLALVKEDEVIPSPLELANTVNLLLEHSETIGRAAIELFAFDFVEFVAEVGETNALERVLSQIQSKLSS